MARCKLDPRRANTLLDNNAFEHSDQNQVNRLLSLIAEGRITLIVPHGVLSEIAHPNTPIQIKDMMSVQLFTEEVESCSTEEQQIARIDAVLQGNARKGRHSADAKHVFEAAKYGGYFITHDTRIVRKKRRELEAMHSNLSIVTLDEYLMIYDQFAGENGSDDS
ncbi:hypothetical protein [Sphingorhabdus sp.]|jgi:hypothetical protein|uniref:hypothetical protein n=1 Tax=Sphingorhabdus sp. TaxID=1902408 RepID=UPI0037C66952